MVKMATLNQSKKTAKTQTRIYFAADVIKPRHQQSASRNLPNKVYKELQPKNSGGISPRGNKSGDTGFIIRTGGENKPRNDRLEGIDLRLDHNNPITAISSGVIIRGDLLERHAVSVSEKSRQKVSNLALKTRQKVSNLAPGQKVSNPERTGGVSGPGRCAST